METLKFMFSSGANSESSEGDSPRLTANDLPDVTQDHQLPFFDLDDMFNFDDQTLNNGGQVQDHEYGEQKSNNATFENYDLSMIDDNLFDILDSGTPETTENPQTGFLGNNLFNDYSIEVIQVNNESNSTSEESFQSFEHLMIPNTVQGSLIVIPNQSAKALQKPQCTILTEDEQSLLAKEGINLPVDMPLTREEEKLLKMVRRKIRNKMSAKVSRMKKQSYVEGLEERVKICTLQNKELQGKVDKLQKQNLTLALQLKKLQGLLFRPQITVITRKRQIQAGGCLMLLMLSFAFFIFPNMTPWLDDYNLKPNSDPWHFATGRRILQEPNLFGREQHAEEHVAFTTHGLSRSFAQEALDEPPDEDLSVPDKYVVVLDNYNQSSSSSGGKGFGKSDL